MNKKIFILCLTILTFSVSSISLANNPNNIDNLLKNMEADNRDERAEVEAMLNTSTAELNQILNKNTGKNKLGEFDWDNAYRVSDFTEPDIVNDYEGKVALKDLVSDDYVWKVPTTFGYVITVGNGQNSTWEVLGISDESTPILDSKDKNSILSNLYSDERVSNASSIQYLISHMYHTTFVYIETADNSEFIIPYGSRPDLTGLENGKIYDVDDAMNVLKDNFSTMNSDGNANSGVDSIEKSSHFNVILALISIAIIVVALIPICYKRLEKTKLLKDKKA